MSFSYTWEEYLQGICLLKRGKWWGFLSSQRIMTSGSERHVLVCVSVNYFENAYSGIL